MLPYNHHEEIITMTYNGITFSAAQIAIAKRRMAVMRRAYHNGDHRVVKQFRLAYLILAIRNIR